MIRFIYLFRWVLVGLLGVFLLWQVYVFLRPAPRLLDVAEERAAALAARTLAEDVESRLGDRRVRVGVVGLVGDAGGQATEALRRELRGRRAFEIEEASVPRAFVRDVVAALADASNLEEVLRAGEKVRLDLIVAGRVRATGLLADGGGRMEVDYYVYDVQAGDWLVRRSIAAEWRPDLIDRARLGLTAAPWWQRLLLWGLVVLVLPWLTPFFARWARARRSNGASTLVLGGYVLTALFLAAALNGFAMAGLGDALILLAALALAGAYSFWACERIAAEG